MNKTCYVYAIVGRDTALPPAGTGADDDLALVPWRKLAAVTRQTRDDAAAPTMEAVIQHKAVVDAVRAQGPALPVRFGTVFRDATSVASAIAERYESLAADLVRLGDKVEMSLMALWTCDVQTGTPEQSPADQVTGASYLHARAAAVRRAEAMQQLAAAAVREVDRILGDLALQRRPLRKLTPRIALRIAYLLEPANVSAFRSTFESMRGSCTDLRLLLTGPWPPYSFTTRNGERGGSTSEDPLAAIAELLTAAMRGAPAEQPRRETTN